LWSDNKHPDVQTRNAINSLTNIKYVFWWGILPLDVYYEN